MSLLCRLGRHRPRGIPRWNDGLYFARCRKCGRDLVRTSFEGWHVPKGYRVVWSDRAPADRPEVALIRQESPETLDARSPGPAVPPAVPDPPTAAASDSSGSPGPSDSVSPPAPEPASPPAPARGARSVRLPIQDVLADLAARDAAEQAGEAAPVPAEAPTRARRSTWDSMDDDPLEEPPAEPGGSIPGATAAQAVPAPQAPPPAPGASDERQRETRSALSRFRSGTGEPRPLLVAGSALAIAAAVALALYSAGYPAPRSLRSATEAPAVRGEGAESADGTGKADPFAASASYDPPGQAGPTEGIDGASGAASGELAYVAASLLVCRAAPVAGAPRVRNLLRGREVRVLGYDGAWASLAYPGGQCWAQAQYLAPAPPP